VHVFFGCGRVVVTDASEREEPHGRSFQETRCPEEIMSALQWCRARCRGVLDRGTYDSSAAAKGSQDRETQEIDRLC